MEMFQPNLTLHQEPDGQLTLDAMTLTPNGCYSAGPAVIAVPPAVRLTAEVLSVLLPIRVHRGHCAMVVTPVRHRIANLAPAGKTTVTAFATIDGRVVGSASAPILPSCTLPTKNPLPIETTGWYAWLDTMPGGKPTFHVVGTVVLPSPGYEAKLEAVSPQGINPKELILALHVVKKPGFWPQIIMPTLVHYTQRPAQVAYEGVEIREPDGDTVHIPVETTS